MVIITIEEMIQMYNEEGLSLREIGLKVGKSKSSIQRNFNNNGWFYDKDSRKFVREEEIKENDSEVRKQIKKDLKNRVVKTTSREEELSYTSFGIYHDVLKALKIKCAVEDLKQFEIVNDALRKFIEDKYFNM